MQKLAIRDTAVYYTSVLLIPETRISVNLFKLQLFIVVHLDLIFRLQYLNYNYTVISRGIIPFALSKIG